MQTMFLKRFYVISSNKCLHRTTIGSVDYINYHHF